jgi:transcriptional regulator
MIVFRRFCDMYQPKHFIESRPDVLQALMQRHPFATVVWQGAEGLTAEHLPLLWQDGGAHGVLIGHVARANPVWQQANGAAVMAVFHGPQHYISPNWYPSKAEHHKAVPTWNYAVVHAHGRLSVMNDVETKRMIVSALTRTHEQTQAHPWQLSDAPEDYIAQMLHAIVGVQMVIERLEGKWKVSQNQPVSNREGVIAGLQQMAHSTEHSSAQQMTTLVQETLR